MTGIDAIGLVPKKVEVVVSDKTFGGIATDAYKKGKKHHVPACKDDGLTATAATNLDPIAIGICITDPLCCGTL